MKVEIFDCGVSLKKNYKFILGLLLFGTLNILLARHSKNYLLYGVGIFSILFIFILLLRSRDNKILIDKKRIIIKKRNPNKNSIILLEKINKVEIIKINFSKFILIKYDDSKDMLISINLLEKEAPLRIINLINEYKDKSMLEVNRKTAEFFYDKSNFFESYKFYKLLSNTEYNQINKIRLAECLKYMNIDEGNDSLKNELENVLKEIKDKEEVKRIQNIDKLNYIKLLEKEAKKTYENKEYDEAIYLYMKLGKMCELDVTYDIKLKKCYEDLFEKTKDKKYEIAIEQILDILKVKAKLISEKNEKERERKKTKEPNEDILRRLELLADTIIYYIREKIADKRGVRIEDLLCILGVLAGYSCQASAREKNEIILTVEDSKGNIYYVGEDIFKRLVEEKYSVWSLSSGIVKHLGVYEILDLDELIKHTVKSIGTYDFGIIRVEARYQSSKKPIEYLEEFWEIILEKLRRVETEYWPTVFGIAIHKTFIKYKEIIPLDIALKIVMENANNMSKVDYKKKYNF
ncbi:MAG: hypothetical protein JW924_14965 [Fusobacteriaceae bacterium]|nr:hypothetical protein [Fusobacteriaceae bacterium]